MSDDPLLARASRRAALGRRLSPVGAAMSKHNHMTEAARCLQQASQSACCLPVFTSPPTAAAPSSRSLQPLSRVSAANWPPAATCAGGRLARPASAAAAVSGAGIWRETTRAQRRAASADVEDIIIIIVAGSRQTMTIVGGVAKPQFCETESLANIISPRSCCGAVGGTIPGRLD